MTSNDLVDLQEDPRTPPLLDPDIEAWDIRPMPDGWFPTTPFVTEDGHGDPVEIPSWLFDLRVVPPVTARSPVDLYDPLV